MKLYNEVCFFHTNVGENGPEEFSNTLTTVSQLKQYMKLFLYQHHLASPLASDSAVAHCDKSACQRTLVYVTFSL